MKGTALFFGQLYWDVRATPMRLPFSGYTQLATSLVYNKATFARQRQRRFYDVA